jgi:homocysteine S-methyltransferase
MSNGLPEHFGEKVLIGSGAMGTLLRLNEHSGISCVELLNLRAPDKVSGVHRAYAESGADVLLTNTFAANPLKLGEIGEETHCRAINKAGLAIARDAADGQAVFCSIGPLELGLRLDDYSDAELQEIYQHQCESLAEGDALVLETFRDVRESRAALKAASDSGLPVIFQMGGVSLGRARVLLDLALEHGVTAVGTNCSHPVNIVHLVEFLSKSCSLPITAYANAGNPHLDRGLTKYTFSAEQMMTVGEHCAEAGASLIGGCCGTTPDHIAALADRIHGRNVIRPARSEVDIVSTGNGDHPLANRPLNKIRELMQGSGFVLSVEVRPTRTKSLAELVQGAAHIAAAGADMIDVPDNAAAMVGRDAMVTAATIQRECGIPTISHKSVTQSNLLSLHSTLLGCWDSGLQGVLCISGDPPATGHFSGLATRVTDLRSSVELLRLLGKLRHGELINGDKLADPPDFCAGCGMGSGKKLGPQLKWLDKKIDAGAEFVFSQPVFSMDQFRNLKEAVDQRAIRMLPGLFPLVTARNATYLAAGRVPGIEVPQNLVESINKYEQVEDQEKFGLEFAAELAAQMTAEHNGIYLIMPFGKNTYTQTAELVKSIRQSVT